MRPRAADDRRGRAIFLDRDGTLVHSYHYPSRTEHLRVFDGIAPRLRFLRESGFRLVVVTNQSAVARGYVDRATLDELHRHLRAELAARGVTLDAIYDCPHHPDGVVAELAVRCHCRKPEPGMILRAADELRLDPARSWMVGDTPADAEAGRRAGCRTVLVAGEDAADDAVDGAHPATTDRPAYTAPTTAQALDLIAHCERARAFAGAPGAAR